MRQSSHAPLTVPHDSISLEEKTGSDNEVRHRASKHESPTGLSTEEILSAANTPFWKRLRYCLLTLFGLVFLGMIVAVIVLVATNPICSVPRNHKWYQNAVIYRINVKAFFDSDGDGVGDFQGIIKKVDYLKSLHVRAIWVEIFQTTDVFEQILSPNSKPYAALASFSKELHKYEINLLIDFKTATMTKEIEKNLKNVRDHIDGIILDDMTPASFIALYPKLKKILPSDKIIGMQLKTYKQEHVELDLIIKEFECSTVAQCYKNIKMNGTHFDKKPYQAYTNSYSTSSNGRKQLKFEMLMQGWSVIVNYGDELQSIINSSLVAAQTQPLMNWNDQMRNNGFSEATSINSNFSADFFHYGVMIQTASETSIKGYSDMSFYLDMYGQDSIKWGEYYVYKQTDVIFYTIERGGFQPYFVILSFNTEPISKNFAKITGVHHGITASPHGKDNMVDFENLYIKSGQKITIFTY